jgi:hypothetical protein
VSPQLSAEPRPDTGTHPRGDGSLLQPSWPLSGYRLLCSFGSSSFGWNIVDAVMLCKLDKQFPKNYLFLCTQAIEVGRIILISNLCPLDFQFPNWKLLAMMFFKLAIQDP